MTTHAPKYAMHRFLVGRSRVRRPYPHRLVRQTRLAAWAVALIGLGDAALLWMEYRHLGHAAPRAGVRAVVAAPVVAGILPATGPDWKGLDLTQNSRQDGRAWAEVPAGRPR